MARLSIPGPDEDSWRISLTIFLVLNIIMMVRLKALGRLLIKLTIHKLYILVESVSRQWLTPWRIQELFSSTDAYNEFVLDYEQAQREREDIKRELADTY